MNNEEFLKSIGFSGGYERMKYIKEIDFEKEIKEYGNTLDSEHKEVSRKIFTDLLNKGFGYDFIYFVIYKLNGQDIIKYRFLVFNQKFQDEVNTELQAYYKDLECKKQFNKFIVDGILKQMEDLKNRPTLIIKKEKKERPKWELPWDEIEATPDE